MQKNETVEAPCMLCVSQMVERFLEIARIQWMRKDLVTRGKQCKHSSQGGAPRACVFLQAAYKASWEKGWPRQGRRESGSLGGFSSVLGSLENA